MQDKIYSRKRFILKPRFNILSYQSSGGSKPNKFNNFNNKHKSRIKNKILKVFIIIIIFSIVIKMILNYVDPTFEAMCENKLKSIATIITNQQSTIIMNKYQYEELYTIEKDENGDIIVIKSNVVPINNLISDLTENIQHEFEKIEKAKIDIPVGSMSGSYWFSGIGPDIPIKVVMLGNLDTEIKSEFIAKGINQTLHRVYVNFYCNMKVATPIKNYEKSITNQVIIAEHVIVGKIPETYYNLEGMDSPDDTLNMIN